MKIRHRNILKGDKFVKKITIKLVTILVIISMISILGACGSYTQDTQRTETESKGKITVGGKDFTEQQVLLKITAVYLKEKGYEVEEASGMSSAVARSALEKGQIDIYWEYTGTGLLLHLKEPIEINPDKAYQKVKEIDKENKLIWLNKAEFNNTYAILMRKDQAEELGIKTISNLASYVNKNDNSLKFATNAEFYAREDGMKGLQKKYNFRFLSKKVTKIDSKLLYNSLKEGQTDVSIGFATDGRIKGFNLVALEDDKSFFPAYNAVPVIREETVNKHKELEDLLNELADNLDTETMKDLNHKVDIEHKNIIEVVREWLVSKKLI